MTGTPHQHERPASTPEAANGAAASLACIEPCKVRVVALVVKRSGQVRRYDCYDPEHDGTGVGDIMSLREDEIWLRTLDWARSAARTEAGLRWRRTGLTTDEVGRVSVFRWPRGTLVRVFVEMD